MSALVTASWLNEHLNDPSVVIADATLPPVGVTPPVNTFERYLQGHIPGAVFFDIDALSDHSTSLPHMLSRPSDFAESMAKLGIGSEMTIIVYEQEGVFSAPRAWWMLRTYGAQKVYILDGGLRAWVAAGYPMHTGAVERKTVTFQTNFHQNAVVDFDSLQRMLAEHEQIVDARSAGRFAGTLPEPRPGISSGHMPDAINIPFLELAEGGHLKSKEKLQELFASKGVDLEQPITTTCGSGVTAAVVALGLEIAGAKDVRLYDGSWAEYAQQPKAIIEKEPAS